MPEYACTEKFQYILTCIPSIWQHIKALPSHKLQSWSSGPRSA